MIRRRAIVAEIILRRLLGNVNKPVVRCFAGILKMEIDSQKSLPSVDRQ